MTVAGCVMFRIVDPYKALLTIQQPEDAAAALAQAEIARHIITRSVDELIPDQMESVALEALRGAGLDGLHFDGLRIIDFAIVRTIRLLQEQWRPNTGFSNFEPPKS